MHLHLDRVSHALPDRGVVLSDPQDHVEGPPDRVEPRDAAGDDPAVVSRVDESQSDTNAGAPLDPHQG